MKDVIKNLILNGIATASDGIYTSQDLQTYFRIRGDFLKNYQKDYDNAVNELINSGEIKQVNAPGQRVEMFKKA
jgi:hypothetical protein